MADEVKAPKKVISIKGILTDLANGKTREEIREALGVTKAEFSRIMKNPKLKGRKSQLSAEKEFDMVDDAPDVEPLPAPKPRTKKEKPAAESTESASTPEAEEATADTSGKW